MFRDFYFCVDLFMIVYVLSVCGLWLPLSVAVCFVLEIVWYVFVACFVFCV